jgi:hypothetical protein
MSGADESYDKKVRAAMRNTLFMIPFLFASVALAVNNPVERWANAVGGRDKVAAIKAIYGEATIEYGGYEGTLKVWHIADGKYRKEGLVASYSLVETLDGTNGFVKQGGRPATPNDRRGIGTGDLKALLELERYALRFFFRSAAEELLPSKVKI